MATSGTVIAALRFRDGVYIAADSQASDLVIGIRWVVGKLQQVGAHPLVIGFSGSMGAAQRLVDALVAQPIGWTKVRRRVDIQRELDKRFVPEYALVRQRSQPLTPLFEIAIWGLCGVYVEGEPRILEYEISGDSCWHDSFHAIGSGAQTAHAIYRTLGGARLSQLSARTALPVLLRIVRTSISVEFQGVSEPIVVWRVDSRGASRLDDEEVNLQLQGVSEWEERDQRALFDADKTPDP